LYYYFDRVFYKWLDQQYSFNLQVLIVSNTSVYGCSYCANTLALMIGNPWLESYKYKKYWMECRSESLDYWK